MTEPTGPHLRGNAGLGRLLGGFALLPFITLAAPFLVLPLLARTVGVDGWAAIAIGQSAGGVGSLVLSYGWNLTGPVELVRARPEDRGRIYGESLLTGAVLSVFTATTSGAAAWALAADGSRGLAAATAVASSLAGFSSAWYAIGLARPSAIALYEALPRLLSIVLAAGLLIATDEALWYPACLALGALSGVALFSTRVARPPMRALLTERPLGTVVRRLRRNASAAASVVAGGAYSAGAVTALSLGATVTETAHAASSDRIFRGGAVAIATLTNALQAWVVHPDRAETSRRQRSSLAMHTALGLVGLVGLTALGPWATGLLFGADLGSDRATATFFGIAYLMLALNSCLARHVLAVRGEMAHVLRSVLVGSAVGVPAIIVLATTHGAAGGAAGIALGELTVVAYLGWAAVATSSGPTARGPGSAAG